MSPLGPVTMETSLVSPAAVQQPMELSVQPSQNHQQVSLSLLIEFLVQRVYHELTVLVRDVKVEIYKMECTKLLPFQRALNVAERVINDWSLVLLVWISTYK